MPVCEPYTITLDDECCVLPDEATEEQIEYWQAVASEMLWVGSGRRVGLCPVTVRACVRNCGGGSGLPVPYKGADGAWRNFSACGCSDGCSCTSLSEVVLDGPVAEVVEVTIDGTALAEDSYRLDKVGTSWRLLRTDGDVWPACQDMTADCGEVGSFCITYLQGIEPGVLAIAAATELTCQLVKACIPSCKTCRLPANVQSVVRRGVAIQFDTARTWMRNLPEVAMFLDSVNPEGLTSASGVWSPDVAQARITQVSGS